MGVDDAACECVENRAAQDPHESGAHDPIRGQPDELVGQRHIPFRAVGIVCRGYDHRRYTSVQSPIQGLRIGTVADHGDDVEVSIGRGSVRSSGIDQGLQKSA